MVSAKRIRVFIHFRSCFYDYLCPMHVWLRLLKTKLLKLLMGSSGPQEETFERFLRASFGTVNFLPLGSAFLFLSDRFHYWLFQHLLSDRFHYWLFQHLLSDRFHYWLFQHRLPWQSPREFFCHPARATSPGRGSRALFPECLNRRQVAYSEQFLSPSQASSPVLRS